MAIEHNAHCAAATPGAGDAVVVAWRRRQLLAAGFAEALADRLATTPGIDLHAVLELAAKGCPPELAVRILDLPDEPWPR